MLNLFIFIFLATSELQIINPTPQIEVIKSIFLENRQIQLLLKKLVL